MSTRRQFVASSAAAASALAFPLVAGAQPKTVKIGVLHPVTGALAYSGQQCREGALMAIEDINKAGGIKSLGGAKIEALLGDAQSTPQAGTAEIEKMNHILQQMSHCGLGHSACNPVLDTIARFRPAYERRLSNAAFEPAFDLDRALAPARQMTGRDDEGAHLPAHFEKAQS